MDTIFFVLRKKQNQVTVLHVIHHSLMPLVTWSAIMFFPDPASGLTITLNSFVHVVMYIYYYMAAHPVYKHHLWWKQYITSLQLVQFSILLTQGLVLLVKDCLPSDRRNVMLFCMAIDMYFVYAFGSFYVKSYLSKKATTNQRIDRSSNGVKLD